MSGHMDIQIIQTHKHTCEYHTMHKNEGEYSAIIGVNDDRTHEHTK